MEDVNILKQIEKKDDSGNTIICTIDEDGVEQGAYEIRFVNRSQEDDAIFERGTYKDGKKEGPFETHFEDGSIGRGTFKNDKMEGSYELYDKSGQLMIKGIYKDSYEEGIWEYYHDNGKLMSKGPYNRGCLTKTWEYYYENGQLMEKCSYNIFGDLDKILEAYDHTGKPIKPDIYREGTEQIESEKLSNFEIWRLKEARLAEKEVEKKQREEAVNRAEAIGGLKGQLKMLSDPEFRKPIGKARTLERQAKAEEIVEVRRARTLLSRAANKALDQGDKRLFSEIEEVAKPYALHNRRIELEFKKKRAERRTKKGRG